MELYNPAMGTLLLAVLVATAVLWIVAYAASFRGDGRLAWRVARVWAFGAAIYAGAWLISAMLPRTSVMRTALLYCDDDLCLTVRNVSHEFSADGVREHFDVRLSSRANHGTRSARGAAVYLTDERDRKFGLADASPVPFDIDVDPGKTVDTTLTFDVPSNVRKLYFEVRMERITYASLIIGSGDVLGRPLLKLAVE